MAEETFDERWNRLPHYHALVEVSTNRFLGQSFAGREVGLNQLVVDLGPTPPPDLLRHRYDATNTDRNSEMYLRRLATAGEIAEAEEAQRIATADAVITSVLARAHLIYHERERYLDVNGRYPTPAELQAIIDVKRPVFQAIVRSLV